MALTAKQAAKASRKAAKAHVLSARRAEIRQGKRRDAELRIARTVTLPSLLRGLSRDINQITTAGGKRVTTFIEDSSVAAMLVKGIVEAQTNRGFAIEQYRRDIYEEVDVPPEHGTVIIISWG